MMLVFPLMIHGFLALAQVPAPCPAGYLDSTLA